MSVQHIESTSVSGLARGRDLRSHEEVFQVLEKAMTTHAAVTREAAGSAKSILTFVVPTVDGCNLRCPYCYIEQRLEPSEDSVLSPENYVQFIEQINENEKVDFLCVQGHEPLLPHSFEYTKAILDAGNRREIPTSLVTNGTYLGDQAETLADLGLEIISVSLDASDSAIHDRQRGVEGAFNRTIHGLQRIADYPRLKDAITVSSVLIPKRMDNLIGMPALLAKFGVRQWTVNPLIKVTADDSFGGPLGDPNKIFQDLLVLQREAEQFSIELTVDDEFSRLFKDDRSRRIIDTHRIYIKRLEHPSGVFRIIPDGRCSVGTELLQEMASDASRWDPCRESGWEFVQRVRRGRLSEPLSTSWTAA